MSPFCKVAMTSPQSPYFSLHRVLLLVLLSMMSWLFYLLGGSVFLKLLPPLVETLLPQKLPMGAHVVLFQGLFPPESAS